jgi:hypothetical protein
MTSIWLSDNKKNFHLMNNVEKLPKKNEKIVSWKSNFKF